MALKKYSPTTPVIPPEGVTQVNAQIPTVGTKPASTTPQLGTASSGGLINDVPYSGGAPSFFEGTSSIPSAEKYTGKPIPTVGSQPQGGFTYNPAIGTQSTATPGSYNPNSPTLDPAIYGSLGSGSGVNGTAIDPNNSLRGQQYLPGATQNTYDDQARAALAAVQGVNSNNQYYQQAANALSGANMPTEFSAMTNESRDMIMNALRAAQSGPDRNQMAKESYDIWQTQTEPQYQQDLRGVGQKAAALGRVGAGMTTNDLTGVLGQRTTAQDLLKRSLINDANQQILQDRIDVADLMGRGSTTLENQDYNRQKSAADLAIQRGTGYNNIGQNVSSAEYNNASIGMDRAKTLADMGQTEFDRQGQNYNQTYSERAYQDQLARTAQQDRIAQQQAEQDAAQAEWDRQYKANQQAVTMAAGQQTQYPSISQPQGNSFASGQAAGAAAPTYTTGGYTGGAPTFYEPSVAQPPDIFSGQGIGLQNNPYALDPNSIFTDAGLGLQRQRFGLAE
jgi:hypothetical protein